MQDFLDKLLAKTKRECNKCNTWFYMKDTISIPIQLDKLGNH